MRNPLYNDDLEHFLQQQVNRHRMFPSDHIWRKINSEVHGRKKWPALSAITVFIIAALVVGTLIIKPQPDIILSSKYKFSLPVATQQSDTKKAVDKAASAKLNQQFTTEQLTKQAIAAAAENIKIQTALAKQQTQSFISNNEVVITEQQSTVKSSFVNLPANKTIAVAENKEMVKEEVDDKAYGTFTSKLRTVILNSPSYTVNRNVVFKPNYTQFSPSTSTVPEINLTEEDKFNKQTSPLEKLKNTSSRFDFRFFVTPSVSYRRLTDIDAGKNNSSGRQAIPYASNYTIDPSQAIRHRSSIGYETGVALGYKLNKKFTVTGGVQFNISQYKIDAYIHSEEPAYVTLGTGENSNTLTTTSSLRSIPGSTPIGLTNRYYELSIPVGIDWKAWSNEKFAWGIAAALQPSYTFDKVPLIITSGFKNYTDGSSLIRNWNLNSNIETYFGYTTGSYRWQIGPQFRYQLLSSLTDKYSIREYLLNYGLKVGVVKSLNKN